MKKLTLAIAIVSFAFVTFTSVAQTTNFFQQGYAWATTLNTNLPWLPNQAVTVSAGADTQNNAPVSASLEIEATPYKSLVLSETTRNTDIAGTVLSQQADAGLKYDVADLRLEGEAGGGYRLDTQSGFVDVKLGLKKKFGANTFAGLVVDTEFFFKSKQTIVPLISIQTGFTF